MSELGFLKRGSFQATRVSEENPLPVQVSQLTAAEDPDRDSYRFIKGGSELKVVNPAYQTTGPVMNCDYALGFSAIGEYLEQLVCNVRSATNTAVYLHDGSASPLFSGTAGTNPDGTTTLTLTAPSTVTASVNQFAECLVYINYTPTGGAAMKLYRRIVSHAAISSTSVALTVTHNIPAGATITSWGIVPQANGWECVPYNMPTGLPFRVECGWVSRLGGWSISVDSGIQVQVSGHFS
jgi:hypothetical protein